MDAAHGAWHFSAKACSTNGKLDLAIRAVAIANRILANENIVDASGHVSARHPLHADRFLISWSRSPEHVTREDIMECALDGTPLNDDARPRTKNVSFTARSTKRDRK